MKRGGKDGRRIYVHDDKQVLTGAIRCSAYVTYCRSKLLNEEGEQVGLCNYNYSQDQGTLICPQCGTKRRQCGHPALKETQTLDKPLCKRHLVQRSSYFNSIQRTLGEEVTNGILELMDNEYADAVEVNMAMACRSVLESLEAGNRASSLLKVINKFFDVFRKYREVKGTSSDEFLMEIFNRLFIKRAGGYQQDVAVATTKAIYDIVDDLARDPEMKPEDFKKEIHKRFALEAPEIAKDYETRSQDKDLIEDVEIIEDE